jgi:hypothetical protein
MRPTLSKHLRNMSTKSHQRLPVQHFSLVLSDRVWMLEGWFGLAVTLFSCRKPHVWRRFCLKGPQLRNWAPNLILSDQLQSTPVDVLLVDSTSGLHWERWLQGVSNMKYAPKVNAQSLPSGFSSDKEKEVEWHSRGKQLQRLGYGVTYWYI